MKFSIHNSNSEGLAISRVPSKTREEFIKFADENFAGDYGMVLSWCFEQAMEYQRMKIMFFENIDLKLNELLNRDIPKQEEEKPKETKEIRFLDGRTVEKKKKEVKENG